MKSHRVKGVVKTIKRAEGFGFVTHPATGEDYFFHRTAVKNIPFADLEPDQVVEFDAVEGPKGLRALDIRVV
jgi:CspA family cold shock protein